MSTRSQRSIRRCPVDFRIVPPGEGVTDWQTYCGESCRIAYRERYQHYGPAHYVPDPRFHRLGDGWRRVTRWVRAALPPTHRHTQKRRRDRRAPTLGRRR